MQVNRVIGGEYFEPHVVDLDDGSGCVWVFHELDITSEGADCFVNAMTEQAKVWAFRTPEMGLGEIIPVRILRDGQLPTKCGICYTDSPEGITYYAEPDLISERGAAGIGRVLTDRSPHWYRRPDEPHSLDEAV
ncbi:MULTISPECIES: hypothetical protein [unclassified Streptomyces]|uniref:hypothetical protein n=1 Tax=unclassified Streptomyces TaxID=2593676 RepID=UPI00136AE54D|nr:MULTISPECIES: hypothetical protein [unclassified Streptomyces]NEA03717.1 hypothetical protein [Streptomyces sp. SID10116]MYY79677.1 hypothetical protein [Streptomyces sp. SID335]MYZ12849.1 hypothetical protein [Streptomyces sp. SID337]NDZ91153.1 hypothetical protein [Streptomyces sp. SID10115]NEB43550.1 hypothetical protein [Streptomyces sp. SID339]